jgi:hypothetical protein
VRAKLILLCEITERQREEPKAFLLWVARVKL